MRSGTLFTFFHLPVILVWFSMQIGCDSEEDEQEKLGRESSALLEKSMEGKQTLEDGSIYEGELSKGEPNGYGKRIFPDGDVFEGLFKNGFPHGYGTRIYKSMDELDRYSGLWLSGKKEGFGTLIYSDSSRMEGHWESDELVYGEYQGSDGVILAGKWNESSLAEGKMKTEKKQ
jgi:hypothetical protein